MRSIILVFLTLFFACQSNTQKDDSNNSLEESLEETSAIVQDSIEFNTEFIADSFDFPVGKPNGKGYYNAQKFGVNDHLGDDWNALTGGNSDLGDPIYVIANGYVKFAEDIKGGWGNVIRVIHQLENGKRYESLYAHCDTILINAGEWVKKGDQIGTIGNVNGLYYAHLHLEIRAKENMPIGGGYSTNQNDYLDPSDFIKKNRIVKINKTNVQ